MAGLVLGNIAGAVVDFIKMLQKYIVDALKWIKQAIFEVFKAVKSGIKTAVTYEQSVVTTLAREITKREDLLYPVAFAILFDFLNVNGL